VGKTVTGTTLTDTDVENETADTATTPDLCPETLPDVPGTYEDTIFVTEEDFDFDGGGYLLTQSNSNISALDRQGNLEIISVPGFHDPSGIRVMSTGDIALAEPDTGGLRVVYRATGATEIAMSGLTNPNGIAVDSDGYVYVSEFTSNGRVAIIEPYTSENWLIAENLPSPNGLALSNDESKLYILTDNAILVTERTGPTSFGPLSQFIPLPAGTSFWSLTLDICDNIYTVNYFSGEVVRILADGSTTEMLVDISEFGSFSALRFGGGEGGWERETLYVTSRQKLFGVPIGLPGRPPVAPVY
jgi:sugar lactone lactonase YvrE